MKKLFLILFLSAFTIFVNAQSQNSQITKPHKVYVIATLNNVGSIIPLYVAKIFVSGMKLQTINDSVLNKENVITDVELINFFADNGWSVVTGIQSDEKIKWVFEKDAPDVKSAIVGLKIKEYKYSR